MTFCFNIYPEGRKKEKSVQTHTMFIFLNISCILFEGNFYQILRCGELMC